MMVVEVRCWRSFRRGEQKGLKGGPTEEQHRGGLGGDVWEGRSHKETKRPRERQAEIKTRPTKNKERRSKGK